MVIKAQLDVLGVQADTAISGHEALNLIKKRMNEMKFGGNTDMYELVLLDYCMPEMDGLETAQAIRDNVNAFNDELAGTNLLENQDYD